MATAVESTSEEVLSLEQKLLGQLELTEIYKDLDEPLWTLGIQHKNTLTHEYIRLIVLKVYFRDFDATKLLPPASVDLLWHAHILHTKHYHHMCFDICNVQYIHHDPAGSRDGKREGRLGFTKGAHGVSWPAADTDNWVWKDGDALLRISEADSASANRKRKNDDSTADGQLLPTVARYTPPCPKSVERVLAMPRGRHISVINDSDGDMFSIRYSSEMTVAELMLLIWHKVKIHPDEHRLFLDHENNCTCAWMLATFGITKRWPREGV